MPTPRKSPPKATEEAKTLAGPPLGFHDPFAALERELRRPFTPQAVKWKIQANPKGEDKPALCVAFIDARLAAERLNHACPGLWSDIYLPVAHEGKDRELAVRCRITLRLPSNGPDELTKHVEDVGTLPAGVDDMRIKGGYSDAFKRACVKLGIGVSLYSIPQQWLRLNNGELRTWNSSRGQGWAISDKGYAALRAAYATWLNEHGIKAFGEPLAHGETFDEQGDVEAGDTTAPVTETNGTEASAPTPTPEPTGSPALSAEDAAEHQQNLQFLAGVLKDMKIPGSRVKTYLTAEFGKSRIGELDPDEAIRLGAWINETAKAVQGE